MQLRITALSLLVVFTLGGCSVLPRPTPSPRYHDFGPVVPPPATFRASIDIEGVTAPTWLERDAIWYRFLDHDPTRLRAYAENRWIAPPGTLIAQAVRDRLLDHGSPRYRLRLRLTRFEQDFPSLTRATVVVRIRATLLDRAGRVWAQKWFQLSAPTTPDVSGAVNGLSTLGEQSAKEITAWAVQCTSSAGSEPRPACGGN